MSYFEKHTSLVKPSLNLKKELLAFPFEEFAEVPNDQLELKAIELNLTASSSWILPQMLAYFGTLKLFKNDEGLYQALPFLEHNFGKDPKLMGMWKVATRLPRSVIVKPQNSGTGPEYSMLVPLILAGLKKYQNVWYTSWANEGLEYLVEPNLSAAMLVDANEIPDLTVDELLNIRKLGLTTATGSRKGTTVAPTSKWALTGIKDTKLGHLPKLAVTMLTQIWVAHPSLRTPYMVLDPNDWDAMPPPLVSTEGASPAKMFSNPTHSKWD